MQIITEVLYPNIFWKQLGLLVVGLMENVIPNSHLNVQQ